MMWDESKLKYDKNEEYDVAFGKEYSERSGKTEVYSYSNMSQDKRLISLAKVIIAESLKADASDIKIYRYDSTNAFVELRIGGQMVKTRRIDIRAVNGLVQAFKRLAGMDVSETTSKNTGDGRISFEAGGVPYNLRVNSIPSIHSETLSIRIIKSDDSFNNLEYLGLPEFVLERFRKVLSQSEGMVVLSGSTGSGKTTTMYTALKEIIRTTRGVKNIHTIEDPVESLIPGTVQNEVNEVDDFTYAQGVRGLLRQNPDIILVGEIRDSASAVTALRAATSGHLLFTTIHTNNALTVPMVMQQYGLKKNEIASALQMVLNQRLVGKLCDNCKKIGSITTKDLNYLTELGLDTQNIVRVAERNKEGCELCDHTGTKGKVLIVEMLDADRNFDEVLNISNNDYELKVNLEKSERKSYYSKEEDVERHLREMSIDFKTAEEVIR